MKYSRNIKGNELRKINGRYESRYLHDAEYVFKELNEVSPSFCLAKWFNVSIHLPTGKTHSCYHPKSHHIPLEEIEKDPSALHNTNYKKEQRKKMLEGERPAECNFCWQMEDHSDQLSDRAYRSKDVYEPEIIEEARKIGFTGNAKPRYVEVNFNQACNFKCAYCSPVLSTEWHKEINEHGPYKLADKLHNDMTYMDKPNNSPDNPYVQAFWKWFPSIYPTLKTFRMTGGEPLMDKNTFKIFDYVKENPKEDFRLSITSNCCPPKGQWAKFMTSMSEISENVDHFMLYCSLDSWGEQAEYIRNGMNFTTLLNNVEDFLGTCKRHSLTFIITFNVFSYSGIFEYIKNILNLRRKYSVERQLIWFDIPPLHSPDFMNAKLNPAGVDELHKCIKFMEQYKDGETEKQFQGFSDFEIKKVQRLIDWIQAPTDFNRTIAMKNFYKFFIEHDTRRKTNLLNTFPEMEKFWEECKWTE